jgi:diguanylate cyclase (GGDEF)-like protein
VDEKIVLIDDDPGTIYFIGRILNSQADIRFATSGETALQLVREFLTDLILLDAELPGMSGFKVFESLKAQAELSEVPVIFITSHNEAGFEVTALNMGAADFIAKPFQSSLVLARVNSQLRLKRATDALRRAAVVDSLTGVASRGRFDESLQREWLRGLRVGDSMAMLLIDVDHFKLYTDRHGHAKGDACLRRVAQALNGAARRPADLLARFAGEQFGLLLPQTSRSGAEHIAHRILDAMDELEIRHDSSPTSRHVTVSIGMSCYDEASACWVRPSAESRSIDNAHVDCLAGNLLLAADKALHSAKRALRSCVRLLDIADLESPHLARNILPAARESRDAEWA